VKTGRFVHFCSIGPAGAAPRYLGGNADEGWTMRIGLLLLVMIAVPVVVLVWTRRGRGRGGDPSADPQGHRDIGAGGPPTHSRGSEWGGTGSNI
jgi:hypothetical protein